MIAYRVHVYMHASLIHLRYPNSDSSNRTSPHFLLSLACIVSTTGRCELSVQLLHVHVAGSDSPLSVCVCMSVTTVSPAKMAESIEMLWRGESTIAQMTQRATFVQQPLASIACYAMPAMRAKTDVDDEAAADLAADVAVGGERPHLCSTRWQFPLHADHEATDVRLWPAVDRVTQLRSNLLFDQTQNELWTRLAVDIAAL